MSQRAKGEKITETGQFITLNDGEKVKVGILGKNGNARVFRRNGQVEVKGVLL